MTAVAVVVVVVAVLTNIGWAYRLERERRRTRRKHARIVTELAKLIGMENALRIATLAGVIDDAETKDGQVQVRIR